MQKFFKYIVVLILTWEARMLLWRRKPFIIAITGSVGKTTTKDAVFHLLKNTTSVRKSEKSFNSEIGIPLTILGLANAWSDPLSWAKNLCLGFWRIFSSGNYPKLLVLEVGADHPNDIKRMAFWLKPDIVVITRLPEKPVHVELFSSPEEVRKEKWELVRALKADGILVMNGDDPYIREQSRAVESRIITFGFDKDCTVKGELPQVFYEKKEDDIRIPAGLSLRVDCEGKQFAVDLRGVLGAQPAMAILAALAVGIARGESAERMVGALGTLQMPAGRMRIINGKEGSTIIDDSYNASPVAAEAALETLRAVEGKRKIALLGDMLELGPYSEEEHKKIGHIAGGFIDILLTVGERAQWITEGALIAGMSKENIKEFVDSESAGKWMAEHVRAGDIILAKGSQGSGTNMIRMERAVKLLMAHPEDAEKILVRQEREWQRQYI